MNMYVFSVVGAVVIVVGLYVVLWGKAKEVSPHQSNHHEREPIDVVADLDQNNQNEITTSSDNIFEVEAINVVVHLDQNNHN